MCLVLGVKVVTEQWSSVQQMPWLWNQACSWDLLPLLLSTLSTFRPFIWTHHIVFILFFFRTGKIKTGNARRCRKNGTTCSKGWSLTGFSAVVWCESQACESLMTKIIMQWKSDVMTAFAWTTVQQGLSIDWESPWPKNYFLSQCDRQSFSWFMTRYGKCITQYVLPSSHRLQ